MTKKIYNTIESMSLSVVVRWVGQFRPSLQTGAGGTLRLSLCPLRGADGK